MKREREILITPTAVNVQRGSKKRLYDRNDVVIDNVKRNGISPLSRFEAKREDSYKKHYDDNNTTAPIK